MMFPQTKTEYSEDCKLSMLELINGHTAKELIVSICSEYTVPLLEVFYCVFLLIFFFDFHLIQSH